MWWVFTSCSPIGPKIHCTPPQKLCMSHGHSNRPPVESLEVPTSGACSQKEGRNGGYLGVTCGQPHHLHHPPWPAAKRKGQPAVIQGQPAVNPTKPMPMVVQPSKVAPIGIATFVTIQVESWDPCSVSLAGRACFRLKQ
jgi:hypothetical protein